MPRKPKASAQAAEPSRRPAPTLFLPTLLPDPFGEASPELCWEWSEGSLRAALRLTQFGWGASILRDGVAIMHWTADHLADLREEAMGDPELPEDFSPALGSRWVLAYEVAGF